MTGVLHPPTLGCRTRILAPPDDVPSLLDGLLARCRPETVHARFRLYRPPDPGYTRTVLLPRLQAGVLLGALAGPDLVGLLNLIDCRARTVEIGLLVADPWQRRGVGTALLAHARALRSWHGRRVLAEVDRTNLAVLALLRRHGRRELVHQSGPEMTYRLTW